MNGSIAGVSACTRSIFRNVGPSDAGGAINAVANSKRVASIDSRTSRARETFVGTCGNVILTKHANAVATTMPQRIDPRTRRPYRTAVVRRPTKNTMESGDAKCVFSFTAVPASLMITPACCNPINAMKSPIPVAIPFFRLGLTALKISSRNPTSDKIKNNTPETNTTPSATCHPFVKPAAVAAGSAEKTKKKFSPMPGAWAMG